MNDKEMTKWRTGLYAANPEQARELVAQIDGLRASIKAEKEYSARLRSENIALENERARRLREVQNEVALREEAQAALVAEKASHDETLRQFAEAENESG